MVIGNLRGIEEKEIYSHINSRVEEIEFFKDVFECTCIKKYKSFNIRLSIEADGPKR